PRPLASSDRTLARDLFPESRAAQLRPARAAAHRQSQRGREEHPIGSTSACRGPFAARPSTSEPPAWPPRRPPCFWSARAPVGLSRRVAVPSPARALPLRPLRFLVVSAFHRPHVGSSPVRNHCARRLPQPSDSASRC